MSMTWKELKAEIESFTEEQINKDVTVYVSGVDEYYSLVSDYPLVESSEDTNDVLDPKSKYLVI